MEKIRTNKEYVDYVEKKAKQSNLVTNMIKAFIVGGIICIIGQGIMDFFLSRNFAKDDASNLMSMSMIFIGAFLTGLNIYDEIGKRAGAGSIVPITGFANSIVSPAMEYKKEGFVMGVGARMFQIAGPVIVYGVCASIIAGIIYYLMK